MNLYPALRPLLFNMDAESSHDLVLKALSKVGKPIARFCPTPSSALLSQPIDLMGLRFPNPLGLAAGLDKNASCAPAFASMGFGFLELGTVTPQPQPGNPKPRMFRIPESRSIINRMGFNSCGLETFLDNLQGNRPSGIIGINLGKNASTPISGALDDYKLGMNAVYNHADYITINISSPNTKNLRDLQEGNELQNLLHGIGQSARMLQDKHDRHVPIVVKIAPDLDSNAIAQIASNCVTNHIDGIIATNTTIARPSDLPRHIAAEAGGLSGALLTQHSTEVVYKLCQELGGEIPVIAAGGIMSGNDAVEKLQAGAQLVQIYTGFIYNGPKLITDILQSIRQSCHPQE